MSRIIDRILSIRARPGVIAATITIGRGSRQSRDRTSRARNHREVSTSAGVRPGIEGSRR
jgi:hypothetical protein